MELMKASSTSGQISNEVHTPMETDAHVMVPPQKKNNALGGEMCRMVGSLITELATPDVLYNNRFWPEEESIRITVERSDTKMVCSMETIFDTKL